MSNAQANVNGKSEKSEKKAPKAKPAEKAPTKDKAVAKTKDENATIKLGASRAVSPIMLVSRADVKVDQGLNFREDIDTSKPSPELVALAIDIRENGLDHPPTVRKLDDGTLELRAGFRRWFATSAFKGQDEEGRFFEFEAIDPMPVVVFSADDLRAKVKSLTENLIRENLTAWEISQGIWAIQDDSIAGGINNGEGYGPTEIGRMIGYSRSAVSNMLGWRKLIKPAQKLLEEGQITSKEANTWCYLDKDKQREALEKWKARHAETEEDEDEDKKRKRGGKGGDGEPRMIRRDKCHDLIDHVMAATEIKIKNKWLPLTDVEKEVARAVLWYACGHHVTYPVRGFPVEQESDEEESE